MNWAKISTVIGVLLGIGAVAAGGWAGWAWAVNYTVSDRFAALDAQVASNSDRLALITFDRLLRKLRVEGSLSPRDLRAFCQSAARLQIRHQLCR